MKEIENIPTELFELLEKKSFEELNPEEKADVLLRITKNEYEEYYKLIADFKSLDEEMEIAPSDFEKIKESSFKGKSTKVYYRIAAGFAILFFAALSFWEMSHQTIIDDPVVLLVDSIQEDKSSQLNDQWLSGRMEMLKESASSAKKNTGVSLANEEYPEEFVLDFGSGFIPGGNLKRRF